MATNKVVCNAKVLIDLTGDTVTPSDLLQGVTTHDKSGQIITGTLVTQNYYTGSTEPSTSLGSDGDLYLMI